MISSPRASSGHRGAALGIPQGWTTSGWGWRPRRWPRQSPEPWAFSLADRRVADAAIPGRRPRPGDSSARPNAISGPQLHRAPHPGVSPSPSHLAHGPRSCQVDGPARSRPGRRGRGGDRDGSARHRRPDTPRTTASTLTQSPTTGHAMEISSVMRADPALAACQAPCHGAAAPRCGVLAPRHRALAPRHRALARAVP
jgi:hypothetical protein